MHYFHDEKAVRKFHETNLDLNLFDTQMEQELLPLGETQAPMKTHGGPRRRAKLVELHESTTVQKIIAELGRIQSSDVVLPLADGSGRELRIRCVVRPDRAQALLLERLGLELPERLRIPPRIDKM